MDNEKRTFRIGPIRPPSEAESLLLQVTEGCTWNKCKFCQLYRHTKFKAYSADSIRILPDVLPCGLVVLGKSIFGKLGILNSAAL